VPRVKSSTSHLYLTTVEGKGEEKRETAGSGQEETKSPEN
jgi:hypothetical protein